ncbi:MAG TPA: PQQ-dependent sugar dehydrogenase [Blastocatellia bacterium]|jgi:glucose/arabinose dehydrogenase
MHKRNVGALCCLAVLLIACPAIFHAGAHPVATTPVSQDKINATTAVQLQNVFTGLSSPVYVTNSHDGTNRLFIIEKPGRILVAQPGATTTTVFLDIASRVLSSGSEQGLLGLAFHPRYITNGRFFVNYTRQTDGATVVAEYHVSATNPNVADTTETVFLTIPQPFTNHNGGMIEFGRDGYLYIGMGDGGSANDPGNRAQDVNNLLGKILRIDVDHPNGGVPYSSPSDNPFFGSISGADEIYATGLRNPWRFSFDRGTGSLYVGDVGQGAREEIDIVTLGGNYGWRVMEGMICNPNFNGGVCTPPPGSILPIWDYSHASGRCSITGGYVYRGARSTVPVGSYIFADYCTGEIWQLFNGAQTLLLDTTFNITSFGEDEAGEIYVVGQSGTVARLAFSPAPPACSFSISPTTEFFPMEGAEGVIDLRTTAGDCGWMAATNVSWITLSTTSGVGGGPFSFAVRSNTTSGPRSGIINIGGKTFNVVQDSSASADCTYFINPLSQIFTSAGGTGSITVTTELRCAWQARTSDSWITITSGQTGIGNGTVSFTVGANTSGKNRKGTITAGNQVFSVKQR